MGEGQPLEYVVFGRLGQFIEVNTFHEDAADRLVSQGFHLYSLQERGKPGLPAPDGPGHWWFEGVVKDPEVPSEAETRRQYWKVELAGNDLACGYDGVLVYMVSDLVGEWWPAITPWHNRKEDDGSAGVLESANSPS